MAEPQNRNNDNDGNGQPNEWYNNKYMVCLLIGITMVCGTVYSVEDELEQQAKNNEYSSENLAILMVVILVILIFLLHDTPQLPMVKVDQERVDSGVQCTICLETFILDEDAAKLDCQHIFHLACIQPWLQNNNTCPVCRTQIEWLRDFDLHHTIEDSQATINEAVRILQECLAEGLTILFSAFSTIGSD